LESKSPPSRKRRGKDGAPEYSETLKNTGFSASNVPCTEVPETGIKPDIMEALGCAREGSFEFWESDVHKD
jgi:hypothetical protein